MAVESAEMMRVVEVAPQDVIDAVKSLHVYRRTRCNWLTEWLSEEQMLGWAKDSLDRNDERGNADALTWAKRAVCARIDRCLTLCLLSEIAPREYPSRVEILRKVGVELPDVVHELVIKPRNELEHLYRLPPDQSVARHAVEIAQLSLRATEAYLSGRLNECRCACIALNWNVLFRSTRSGESRTLEFQGFANKPMVFVDVFDDLIKVKIIDPVAGEIRFTCLPDFDKSKTIQLCTLLNQWSDDAHSKSEGWETIGFFRAAKQALKF
jgi:hypothetical protein